MALLTLQKSFYTAIGHSTDFTLADKYSDESFVTPSDLGSIYSSALAARDKRENLERQLDTAIKRQGILQNEKDSQIKLAAEREQAPIAKAKRNLQIAIVLAVLLSLIVLVWIRSN